MEPNLEITVQFQDEERITYSLPMNSSISDLISMIKNDSRVSVPENSQINIMFLGHFLQESMKLKEIGVDSEYVVNCIFRTQKNSLSPMEIKEEEEEEQDSVVVYSDESEILREIFEEEEEENEKGWTPFLVGAIIGMLFGYHWLMFLLLIYPNVLLFIGYAFGAGLVISAKNCLFL